jgi:hypothetical protein
MRCLALTAPLLLVVVGLSGAADHTYPIFTADQLTSTMKLVGRNFAAVNASLAQKDFETAKAQLTRSRELLAVTITFWKDRKKDDAIKILNNAVTKMDDLDTALSLEDVDLAAASAIAKQIGAGCQACHGIYREQDPATKAYRLKSGSVQ